MKKSNEMPRASIRAHLNKSRRLLVGFFLLIFVNVLWVGSSELTKYIFNETHFDRPFFTTYIKTCMFTIYLLGFMFHRPWRDQCVHGIPEVPYDQLEQEQSDDEDAIPLSRHLSDPEFEPINSCSDIDSERSSIVSDTEHLEHIPLTATEFEQDPPADPKPPARKTSVRFSRTQEVRHMPECEAEDAKVARLPFEVWKRLQRLAVQYKHRLTVRHVAKLALTFTFIWFIGNLGYQEALKYTTAGVVNVLSSSSSLFTLVLAALFPSGPGDRFTVSKLCLVVISIVGMVLVTLVDRSGGFEHGVPVGAVWAVIGSIGYACYLVLLRRRVDSEEKLDIAMFFGFVGLFSMVFLWPVLYVLHTADLEPFYPLPDRTQFLFVVVNGLIGTVLSEYLWLWGCFLTNSLVATLSLGLTVPLTVVADAVLWEKTYPWEFFLGMAPILIAFFGSALLAQYENTDPVYDGLRLMFQKLFHIFGVVFRCCRSSRRSTLRVAIETNVDREEGESLIIQ